MTYNSRFWPTMSFPIPRGEERYRQLLQLFDVARRMGQYGIRIDMRRARWHLDQARTRAEHFTRMFLDLTKLPPEALGDSGAGTTAAVRDYFWKELGAPHVSFHKRTKKPQFNTASLIIYATDFKGQPFSAPAAALYGIRKARTAERFARAYLAVAEHEGGRIRFGFNPLGTKGERWSSSATFRWKEVETGETVSYSLNAQNVPAKEPTFEFEKGVSTKLSLSMRDCFIPDPGCVFLKADYDQLELRLIAYTAGAKKLIEWINSGKDTHMENARGMFLEGKIQPHEKKVKKPSNKREEDLNKWREAAKPCAYAISYQAPSGSGKDKYPDLYKQLKQIFPDLPEAYVSVLVKRFFDLHPEIRAWQGNTAEALTQLGRIELKMTGAMLYLPDSPRGRNQALNFQMQSGGGALINRAIINIDKHMSWQPGESALLAMVHDEVDAQAPLWDVERVKEIIDREMGAPAQIGETYAGIPASADPGLHWGSCIELPKFFAPDGPAEGHWGSGED